ncbi:MAG: DUF1385 domain-containing protein [Lachnospiraceae bacterium]|jgi:uncharacterized protein YqhQ|nr:DUF1385 domain-containing protein [Lachnospiraceae bacterium]MCI1727535.1 DUF1385 domain-containing protein [Lachnospiraceae bacterium]
MQHSSGIGGQAVLEGIMMRNRDKYAIAVRKPDSEIEVDVRDYKSVLGIKNVEKIPIIRGVSAFLDSLVIGTSCTMWSAKFFDDEEEEAPEKDGGKKKKEKDSRTQDQDGTQKQDIDGTQKPEVKPKAEKTEAEKKKEERQWNALMTGTVVFSIIFSVAVFILLPYFLASLLRRFAVSETTVLLAEAFLRIAIFLLYMFLISRMKDIQRVFAYHGAEHKCINCIEHNLPLTPDNVLLSSRQHKRCGTSFLLIVIVISVICYLFIGLLGITSPLWRVLIRILLIPVIAGLSYELLRYTGSHDSGFICALSSPGLQLQKLVTREPDRKMTEVAISAVEAVFDWKKWQEENFSE